MSTNNEPTNELATNSLQAQSIDCVGTTYVKPVMWRTRLASVIALLIILLGVFLYSQGLFSIGIALITVCLACLAILESLSELLQLGSWDIETLPAKIPPWAAIFLPTKPPSGSARQPFRIKKQQL